MIARCEAGSINYRKADGNIRLICQRSPRKIARGKIRHSAIANENSAASVLGERGIDLSPFEADVFHDLSIAIERVYIRARMEE